MQESDAQQSDRRQSGPLQGLRIVEIGHFIAGPFASRLMADLGAEVIKIEPPVMGDPARQWGLTSGGRSVWWSVHARNKRCITLDLKSSDGRDLALKLIETADAVIENFRPGQLEKWGIGPENIAHVNPECILVRISGFGQNGPYRDKVSFGVIGEAIGGIRHLTAYPPEIMDLPPIRNGVSLADSLAGLYAVIGLLTSLVARVRSRAESLRTVDVALYETVFSLLEGCLPEYGQLGVIRAPTGSTLPTNAPSNVYRCSDKRWIVIAGNSDRIFQRLMALIERIDLSADPRLANNQGRVSHAVELDEAIGKWTALHTSSQALAMLEASQVPASLIYNIEDCADDPHFHARKMITEVEDPSFGRVLHPGTVPKFSGHDEFDHTAGPSLGADNEYVFGHLLGLGERQQRDLKDRGVV